MWYCLGIIIIRLILLILAILAARHHNPQMFYRTSSPIEIIETIVFWVTFIPSLAVATRRLHDIGRSGLNILWVLLPLLGSLIIIHLCALEGEPSDNKYGRNPRRS